MRYRLFALLSLALAMVLGACGPGGALEPTAAPSQPPPPTAFPTAEPAFVQTLRAFLVQRLGLAPEQVVLSEYEAVEWDDACLGVIQPGELCAQVITPGYRVVFITPQGPYEFHTDQSGQSFRLLQPNALPTATGQAVAILWERSGGIAGICQRLTLYFDGTHRLQDCATERTLNEGALSQERWGHLADWLNTFRAFDWKFQPPPGSADMFADHYTFNGRGRRAASVAEQAEVNDYLAALASELAGPATPLPGGASGESGIEGQVFIGPTCPVLRIGDTSCLDQPYQATITVLMAQTRQPVTSFQTDVEGRFRVTLPPGTYLLHPESPGRYPFAQEETVTVTRGQFTQVTLTYDSGIR